MRRNIPLSLLMSCLLNSSTEAVYANLVIVDAKNVNRIIRYYDSSSFTIGRLRFGWMPAHPTLILKRSLYERYGGFSLDYEIAADFEIIVRLFHSNEVSHTYLPETVIKMRDGGVSNSGLKSTWKLNREIVKACRANGVYTNMILLLSKLPGKLMEYVRKPA